ncbi:MULTISPECIES: 2-succinyl-6-hydroxy-2,4-cyclohexadiene-1-carboxylate synthase [Pontibacillus]|uniref:Putative 2-succinyl-6-hydroxy-2,4-cyclohexadiene-1-carboxylate synthase n=1 Tax=Pontibacillus chungwhensis TaxID=265426 RepID=A0ABY8UVB0_9BACI|nr:MULTISPECIES: 2-succinyl-6-hydroxy-2,4-cyclohexadiene-1-carboxylate synthase [Pontibacillus]MCD5325103.1 2-succinyl-6-hydroxy-2,4-cyclohexadiene-1-carboxylate synthase [Pontibacillus sp. HN14]WIF97353.1 2-succinyl-6-hydroxy-2,4-cyclohexadiene-1-carboxylate synthase [Pontibacillus chungwhensis]
MYITIHEQDYWVESVGQGIPVLLLHGFTGTHSTWDNLVENDQNRIQWIRIDLPGHGKTEASAGFTMESVCKDISELLEHLSLPSVHVVGYSMGGRTALSFAMAYPEMVRSLTLESASPGLHSTQDQLARQTKDEGLAQSLEKDGIEAFVEKWENLDMFQSQKNLPQEIQSEIRRERMKQSPKGLAASLRGMGTGVQPSWWDRLSTFTSPVLLLTGEWDEKFTAIANQMEDHFLHASHHNIPQTGHAIHVEQAQTFAKIVSEFIFSSETR